MKDVFDCNPELTVAEVREWADNESNDAMATYLRNCIERKENGE